MTRAAVLLMLVSALAVGAALAAPRQSEETFTKRDDAPFVRGVALGLFATDPEWDYGALVEEIRARGATDVLVVVNAYQTTRFASDIALRPGRSPSEATVARTLAQVRAAGMRAALMPVVRLEQRATHEWRGMITPADGLDAWFTSYRRFVLPLARLAEEAGTERLVIGSELSSLERYEDRWRRLIMEARERFSGAMTYSANWDHANAVGFWDALDEVGLTAYFPVGGRESPIGRALADAWRTPLEQIDGLRRRTGKPVLITEVGYTSQRGAAAQPWEHTSSGEVDLQVQRDLYRGFCDAFSETPSVSGFYVWNWFGFGGPRDAGFTPRGKPAANELARCFARQWPAPAHAGNES